MKQQERIRLTRNLTPLRTWSGVRWLYSGEARLMEGVLIGEADRCRFPAPTRAPSRDWYRKQSVGVWDSKLIKLRIAAASSRRLATPRTRRSHTCIGAVNNGDHDDVDDDNNKDEDGDNDDDDDDDNDNDDDDDDDDDDDNENDNDNDDDNDNDGDDNAMTKTMTMAMNMAITIWQWWQW